MSPLEPYLRILSAEFFSKIRVGSIPILPLRNAGLGGSVNILSHNSLRRLDRLDGEILLRVVIQQ